MQLNSCVAKSREGGKHGAAHPCRVFAVQSGRNIDVRLRTVFSERSDVLVEPICEPVHKGGATSQDNVVVQVDLEIGIALFDSIICNLSDAFTLGLLLIVTVARVKDDF